jgi:hypothetical protein
MAYRIRVSIFKFGSRLKVLPRAISGNIWRNRVLQDTFVSDGSQSIMSEVFFKID